MIFNEKLTPAQQRANRIELFRDLIVNPDPRDTLAPPVSMVLDDFEREVRAEAKEQVVSVNSTWIFLISLALLWGFLSGLSFAQDMWLDPGVAIFGMLGIGVITASVYTGRKGFR